MARKKKEEVLQIESTTNDTKENILLQENIDVESIKNELKEYVDGKINQTFLEELEKSNKKLIREKSKKIFWKNFFIIILLLIIGFLIYLLYTNNYFDKYFNKGAGAKVEVIDDKKEEVTPTPTPVPTITPTPTPVPTPTQEELKKEYGSLLDNYYVTDSSIYLVDYYDGKLTDNMKKYMVLNSFDFSSFEKGEDYNIIKESLFKMMYENMFSDDYKAETFKYDDNKVRYVKAMESYMSTEILVRDENHIKREIKNIKLDGSSVIITTIEGIVKDNKLYNVMGSDVIADYNEESLLKYEDKLNTLTYTFRNNKLIDLTK